MGKYSAEEVREMASALINSPVPREWKRKAGRMLNDYAERIEAPEGAVAVAKIRHFDYHGIARNGFSQEAEMLDGAPELPDGTELFTHPPAQAAQVDDKVVVIRDGKSTTQGLVLAAAIYMRAVKDVFALWPDGPPYNERKVTKDAAALRAFDHLDAATKALRSAISHFAPTAEPVAQGETSIPTVIDDLTFRLIEAIEERDHLRADLAAQPRAVPDANGHFWVAEPAVEVSNRHLAIAGVPSKYWDEARKAYALAAAPSPPSNVA